MMFGLLEDQVTAASSIRIRFMFNFLALQFNSYPRFKVNATVWCPSLPVQTIIEGDQDLFVMFLAVSPKSKKEPYSDFFF